DDLVTAGQLGLQRFIVGLEGHGFAHVEADAVVSGLGEDGLPLLLEAGLGRLGGGRLGLGRNRRGEAGGQNGGQGDGGGGDDAAHVENPPAIGSRYRLVSSVTQGQGDREIA